MSEPAVTLGTILFRAVEAAQGAAFVSDAVEDMPDDRVLAIARGALVSTERTAQILRRFLKAHDHKRGL